MSYPVLSLVFLVLAALVLVIALAMRPSRRALLARWGAPVAIAAVVVVALTAVFDNVMIRAGLVAYAPGTISGVFIGVAPLEDFAYPVATLMLLPALWLMLGRGDSDDRT